VFTGPLGTVRTLYTITLRFVNPFRRMALLALSLDEWIRTVAGHSFMSWSHSMLSGTIGFITDLRMHAVIANVESALRV
jgi:hypothetical protein